MKNLPFVRQCIVSAGTICNTMGQGCIFGYSSVLLYSLRLPGSTIKTTPNLEGWIASIIGLGFVTGIPIMIIIMDKLGRRKAQIITTIPFLMGWFLIALAETATSLVMARFVQGLAVGLNMPVFMTVIGEITAPKYRGMFLVALSLSLTIGTMLIQYIGIVLSWQTTAIAATFLPFISLIIFINGPESPHWLVSKSRYREAEEVFVYLRGETKDCEEELDQLIESQKALQKSKEEKRFEKEIFMSILRSKIVYFFMTLKKPEFYKPLLIILHSYFFSILAGPHIIASYASDVITSLLGSDCNVYLWIIITNCIRLVSNISFIVIFKKVKRKKILLIGSTLSIICYLAKAGYIYGNQNNWITHRQWIPMTVLIIFCTVNVTSMTFTTVIAGEIYPLEYRGLAGGIGVLGFSVCYFACIKTFPSLNGSIGFPLTYVLYSVIILINLVIVLFILPETKDKTLQDIEDIFRGANKRQTQELQNLESDN